jgi:hypothetical protein
MKPVNQNKRFYSKKDTWLAILIWLIILMPAGFALVPDFSIIGVGILSLVSVLLLWIWYGTYYEFEGNMLKVVSGPIKQTVDLSKARKIIMKSTDLTSSGALSADRMKIFYKKYSALLISPENKKEFLAEVKKICPDIEVVE